MHTALLGLLVLVQDPALAGPPALESPPSQTQEADQDPGEELTPADTAEPPSPQSQSKNGGFPRKRNTFSVLGLLVASAGLFAGAVAALVGVLPSVCMAAGLASLYHVYFGASPTGVFVLYTALAFSACFSPFGFAFFGCLPGVMTAACVTVGGSALLLRRKMPWLPTLAAAALPFACTGLSLVGWCTGFAFCGTFFVNLTRQLSGYSNPVDVGVTYGMYGSFFVLAGLSFLSGQCVSLAILGTIWATLASTASEDESTVPFSLLWEDGSLVGDAIR